MTKLRNLASQIENLDPLQLIIQAVKKNEDFIIALNTDDQLYEKGVDSKGNKLPLPYAPLTIQLKTLEGLPTDRITLRQTGDFHRGFYLKTDGSQVVFDSKDPKTEMLKKEWGEDIFGLTKENVPVALEKIRPDFRKAFNEAFLRVIRNV